MTNHFIQYALAQYMIAEAQEKKRCEDFKARAEEARKKYWDACNYPRKTKKKMRKEAKFDFVFYTRLAEPVLFTF